MKKSIGIWIAVVCILMAAPARAQFHFGFKGGMNFSRINLSGSALNGDDRRGWFIGPTAEFTVPILGVGLDVSALYTHNVLAVTRNGIPDAKLKTFEFPINIKWSVGLGSLFGVYVAAGPQFGINVGNKIVKYYTLEKNTTSFNVGAGVKLIKHIQVGANYNFGLGRTAICSISNNTPYKVKNNGWQASLAYLF